MKIVFVSKECPPSPRSWGIGTYVWETGRALARLGHNVTIIAASDDGQLTSSTPSPRIRVIRLPDEELGIEKRCRVARILCAPRDEGVAYRRRIADCIAAIIKSQHPDIIEFPGFRGESVMWLAGQRLLPMVARMHGITAGVNAVWRDSCICDGAPPAQVGARGIAGGRDHYRCGRAPRPGGAGAVRP